MRPGTLMPVPSSILDPRSDRRRSVRVCVLAVYSLSKQSNLAGYRSAFLAGCTRSS